MNICIIATLTINHVLGGREVHIKDLSEELVKKGHKVSILTTEHPRKIEHENINGVDIFYYHKKNPIIYRTGRFRDFIDFFEKINQQKEFDVVHSHQTLLGYSFLKYSKRDIAFVTTQHGSTKNDIKSALLAKTIKGIIKVVYLFSRVISCPVDEVTLARADRAIAVSSKLKNDLKKQYGVPEEKLIAIPNGVDIKKFKQIDVSFLREKLQLKDKKVILTCGRLRPQKGFQLLIKVLPEILKHQEAVYLIIGQGPYLGRLKDIACRNGVEDKVIFLGKIPSNHMPQYYNLADVFVFPTLIIEGLPLVVLEAMACKKPTIASAIGGTPTIIEDGKDGVLIKPGDTKALEKKVLEVLSRGEFFEMIGKNAREKIVCNFSLDKMVDDTIKVYKHAIYERKRHI